jgi:DNA invertase Pin-like site-specific DNA recombinase
MRTCVIYTRQSKADEGDERAVARQMEDCERLAGARGWQVTHRLPENNKSASTGTRPKFAELLRLVDAGAVDFIVVWQVDRLVRRLDELEDVISRAEKAGVKLVTVTGDLDLSTPAGKLVGRILASVARNEVEQKSLRQQRQARQDAEAGLPRKSGKRPAGWLDDRMTAHPAEGPAIAAACRMILAGGSVASVARDWEARGLGRLNGSGRWTRVTKILRSPRIAGLSVYQGEIVGRGQWEPLVSEQTWRAVMSVLGSRAARPGGRTLLGALARCRCGTLVTAAKSSRGYRVYRCRSEDRAGREGPHVSVRAELADRAVARLAIRRLSRPDAADLLSTGRDDAGAAALRDEAQAIRARLRALGPDYAGGVLSAGDARAAREWGEARLDAISSDLAVLGRESVLAPLIGARDVGATWAGLGISRQRAVIDALMTVTLRPPPPGLHAFDPRTVCIGWRQD